MSGRCSPTSCAGRDVPRPPLTSAPRPSPRRSRLGGGSETRVLRLRRGCSASPAVSSAPIAVASGSNAVAGIGSGSVELVLSDGDLERIEALVDLAPVIRGPRRHHVDAAAVARRRGPTPCDRRAVVRRGRPSARHQVEGVGTSEGVSQGFSDLAKRLEATSMDDDIRIRRCSSSAGSWSGIAASLPFPPDASSSRGCGGGNLRWSSPGWPGWPTFSRRTRRAPRKARPRSSCRRCPSGAPDTSASSTSTSEPVPTTTLGVVADGCGKMLDDVGLDVDEHDRRAMPTSEQPENYSTYPIRTCDGGFAAMAIRLRLAELGYLRGLPTSLWCRFDDVTE